MPRVRKPRAHDARIARRDRRAAVAGDKIRDQDEFVGELALRIAQHETFLIGADRRADRLGRDFEKRRVELADQHDRPFDEAGDFLQEPLVLDEFEPVSQREIARVGENDFLAPVGVEHDLGLFERGRRNRRSGGP